MINTTSLERVSFTFSPYSRRRSTVKVIHWRLKNAKSFACFSPKPYKKIAKRTKKKPYTASILKNQINSPPRYYADAQISKVHSNTRRRMSVAFRKAIFSRPAGKSSGNSAISHLGKIPFIVCTGARNLFEFPRQLLPSRYTVRLYLMYNILRGWQRSVNFMCIENIYFRATQDICGNEKEASHLYDLICRARIMYNVRIDHYIILSYVMALT